GSDGDTNFGVTSLAAPNAASSSVARYSLVARLTACASSALLHCVPGMDRCLLASAIIRLASTAKPSPPTRPAAMQCANTTLDDASEDVAISEPIVPRTRESRM